MQIREELEKRSLELGERLKRLKDEYDLRYYQAIEKEKNEQKRKSNNFMKHYISYKTKKLLKNWKNREKNLETSIK